MKWTYIQVLEVCPGLGGIIRVIAMKIKGRVTKWPVSNLWSLSISFFEPSEQSVLKRKRKKNDKSRSQRRCQNLRHSTVRAQIFVIYRKSGQYKFNEGRKAMMSCLIHALISLRRGYWKQVLNIKYPVKQRINNQTHWQSLQIETRWNDSQSDEKDIENIFRSISLLCSDRIKCS